MHFGFIEDLASIDSDSCDKITAYARDVIASPDIVLGDLSESGSATGCRNVDHQGTTCNGCHFSGRAA